MENKEIIQFTEQLKSVFENTIEMCGWTPSIQRLMPVPLFKKGEKVTLADKLTHPKLFFKRTVKENYYVTNEDISKIIPESKLDLKEYERINPETGTIEQAPCVKFYTKTEGGANLSIDYYKTIEDAQAAYDLIRLEQFNEIKKLIEENKDLFTDEKETEV